MEHYGTTIRSSRFDRERKLSLHQNRIEFDSRDLIGAEPERFHRREIAAFRYGTHRMWYFSYRFEIDVLMRSGSKLELRMRCWFWIGMKRIMRKQHDIVQALFDIYFLDHARDLLRDLNAGLPVKLNDCFVTGDGISLRADAPAIPWQDVVLRDFRSYFAVRSVHDGTNYRAFDYFHDWNSAVLNALIRTIIDRKESEKSLGIHDM
jgi:hypothetical protein